MDRQKFKFIDITIDGQADLHVYNVHRQMDIKQIENKCRENNLTSQTTFKYKLNRTISYGIVHFFPVFLC